VDAASFEILRQLYPIVAADDLGFCFECHKLLPLIRVTLHVNGSPITRSWPKHAHGDACRGTSIGLLTLGPSWISWSIYPIEVMTP
jgi:hypothetical protein